MTSNRKIELESTQGVKKSFDFSHALSILILGRKSGKACWKIADDKNYYFENDEIIKRKRSRSTEESEK